MNYFIKNPDLVNLVNIICDISRDCSYCPIGKAFKCNAHECDENVRLNSMAVSKVAKEWLESEYDIKVEERS